MLHLCNWVGQSISAILLPAHRSWAAAAHSADTVVDRKNLNVPETLSRQSRVASRMDFSTANPPPLALDQVHQHDPIDRGRVDGEATVHPAEQPEGLIAPTGGG
jgi:hypothetical protein